MPPAASPAYDFNQFVSACTDRSRAKVLNPALRTAPRDFGLQTEQEILDWIAAGGIEKPVLANTEVWKNNPNPAVTVWVDSYDFYSGNDFGYLAFMYWGEGFKGRGA